MKKERPLEEALSIASRLRPPEYSHLRPTFKEVQKVWWDLTEQFRNVDEYLASYVQKVAPRWIAAASTLSRLSNKELEKLKGIQPRPDYLAKYKLITLLDRTPKPGDAFIDIITEGAAFVWSPSRLRSFKRWRKMDTSKRDVVFVDDLVGLYAGGRIENLERLNPNLFINEVVQALKK